LRGVALALLAIATGLSAWLAYQSLQSGPVPGCQDGDCGTVLASKWARTFGIPVGVFGSLTYLGLITLARRPLAPDNRTRQIAAAALLLLVPAAGLWFAGLQLFVIKAFCKWCSATHAIATTGAILMALAWRREMPPAQPAQPASSPQKTSRNPRKSPQPKSPPSPAPKPLWAPATALATLAFAGFVIAQSLSPEPPKRRFVTASMTSTPTPAQPTTPPAPSQNPTSPDSPTTPTTTPTPTATPAPAPTPTPPPDTLALHDGRFVLRPADLPHYGSLEAPHRFVMISDYTCVHCRHANQILAGVRESYGPSDLAIVMLPTHHGGESLEIQRLMLAAWHLDPKVWSEVGTELYFERMPARIANVRPALESRLGAANLANAVQTHDAWTSNLVATTRQILIANREKTKSGSIPQFIIGSEIVVGSPDDAGEFHQLIEKHLGLVRDRFPVLTPATSHILVGKVFAGTSRALSFAITNTGNAPLVLSRVTPPPGGRLLRAVQAPIPPGASADIELALAAPRDAGPFDHELTFFSNARSNQTSVRISGLVWKPIQITPQSLDFGRLDPDNVHTQGVLRLDFEEPARVASVQSHHPGFTAEVREVTPRKTYEVAVSTTASLAPGTQQATLVVTLAQPVPEGWPETLAFSARATVDRPVSVVPQRFVVPSGPLPNERHLQALVRCSDSTPDFQIISAVLEGGPAFAMPQIQPTGGAAGTIIRFTLPAGWSLPPPPLQPRLVIQTTHPKSPTLEVPFVTQ
jgi:uncharacterized membrane protein